MSEKIAVIGAGVVGILVARKLQRDGHKVILFDPEPPAMQCSFGHAGYIAIEPIPPQSSFGTLMQVPNMLLNPLAPLSIRWRDFAHLVPWGMRFVAACRPSQVEKGTKTLTALLSRSKEPWLDEIKHSGLGRFLKEKGIAYLYESAESHRSGTNDRETMRRFGLNFQELSASETLALIPGVRPDIYGSDFVPGGAHVTDPHGLCVAVVEAFIEGGGEFKQQPVLSIKKAGATVVAVTTPEGEVPVCSAVIAAGQATKRLAGDMGINVPIIAERGYHVMLEGADVRFNMPVGVLDRGIIITPMRGGLRIAGTAEFAKQGRPETWVRADEVLAHGRAIFPDLGGEESSRWMGERPSLPDYLPMVGRAPKTTNLYVACGHQHLGLSLAALTGEMIAALVAGKDEVAEMAPLSVGRFG